jgi:hypothetical protein
MKKILYLLLILISYGVQAQDRNGQPNRGAEKPVVASVQFFRKNVWVCVSVGAKRSLTHLLPSRQNG